MSRRRHGVRGFTLVEMVVAILLLGILGAGVGAFISRPVEGYLDLARRAALVDVAETALRRMERDVRSALPYSVRVTNLGGGGFAVEMLPVIDGGMYRISGSTAEKLVPTNNDAEFDLNGFFQRITVPSSSTTHRIVINNEGPTSTNAQADAYRASGTDAVITSTPMTITYSVSGSDPQRHHVSLSANHRYYLDSSYQRFFIIEQPVSYLCMPNASAPESGTLIRYANYAINGSSNQPTDPAAPPLATATSSLIASYVSVCTLTTTTADIATRLLATFALTLEKEGEQVRLLHQVQVENSP